MEAEAPLFGSDQAAWLDRLATEHENLRSAITWVLERELHESVARMLAALRRYWMIRADPAECLGWLRPLLDDGRLSLATRGRALVAAAILGCYQDPTTGEAWAQGAVEVGEALGDQPLVVEALGLVAANSYFSGKPDAAAGDRAASLAAELDDDVLKGWALLCSALAHYEHAAARDRALEDALEATATSGDLWVRSLVAGNLANAYVPDPARAQKAFTEAIRLEEVLGTSDAINKANLSWLLLDVGDTPQARVWVSRALRATGRTVYSSLAALDCAAAYACATQHWDRAAQLCGFIDQMARQSGIGVYGDKAQSGPSDSLTDRASLRTSLGEAYDPTYRVGTAMDWGDALRLARGIAAEPQEWDV
jgi:tetratricopeptide (TPR) repeat protein